jgi:hypothetical protein
MSVGCVGSAGLCADDRTKADTTVKAETNAKTTVLLISPLLLVEFCGCKPQEALDPATADATKIVLQL